MHFRRNIETKVARAIADGVRTLPEMITRLPGVFPLEIVKAARAQNADILFPARHISHLKRPERRLALIPHPLDFDWRFSRQALETLSEILVRLGARQRAVYCFGCPTVAHHFTQVLRHPQTHLYDINAGLHSESVYRSWEAGKRCALSLSDGIAVADPPWYQPHFREFIWTVRESCALGTDLLLCGPPAGTRPGCAAEMRALLKWADRIGFEVVSHQPFLLPYLMPLFELNTLRAHGVSDVPLDWRKADLWHLKLCHKPRYRAPRMLPVDQTWQERKIGPVRVRIRLDGSATVRKPVSFLPLGNQGFLDSVSSRGPLRERANVVTSGGRFYVCNRPNDLMEYLEARSKQRRCVVKLPADAEKVVAALIAEETNEAEEYNETVCQFERR
ncbi:MAG: hypothetical protein H7A44_08655 [Opitutaceae bacterium]|nr:hypothetical protein [Opitutaceae bacterium]